ncbi:AtpZ/AtpI family protein [Sphingoaurantiacus capsulatus]|uniref:ATP synthase protein I n=1 Tax=Sphingoaurantiacus capsulatus TaxID=1771310 RepID=A0ABV7XDK2_9SPHN
MGTVNGQQDPNSDADDSARLDRLDERLKAAQAGQAAREGKVRDPSAAEGYGLGNQVIALLIGGIAGGALIGWLIDRWFGTSPAGLLVVMFLGIAAAFRSIIRLSTKRPDNNPDAGGA